MERYDPFTFARRLHAALNDKPDASLDEIIILIASMLSDADLLTAYQQTNGQAGNPAADALRGEAERRGLNA